MRARKRTLALAAAGALLPITLAGTPAYATHITERTIDNACPSEFTDGVANQKFTDVDPGNIFFRHINCLNDYGVAKGKTATTYAPADFNLRRQMALFIYREATLAVPADSAAWEDTPTAQTTFSDLAGVVEDQETLTAITRLNNAGIALGFTDGTYGPNLNITRDQMASFIARMQRFIEDNDAPDSTFAVPTPSQDYFDDDTDNVHEDDINVLAAEGVTIGRGSDRTFEPRGLVTRQQMAGFLARKLDILVSAGATDSVYPTTPTPTPTATASGNGPLKALRALFR